MTTYTLLLRVKVLIILIIFTCVNDKINNNVIDPVDTGRKLIVHKTFRRRPGRLLNVLCTFSLRPVSTGKLIVAKPKAPLHLLFSAAVHDFSLESKKNQNGEYSKTNSKSWIFLF